MIASLFRKARKFLSGQSPAYRHQMMLKKMISLYHTLLLGMFYYIILTPLSIILRTFHGPFLSRDGTWKKRE